MKKIALIYMGGTFGCIGEPLSPMPAEDFIPQLQRILPLNLEIECFVAPSIKDSSACTATDWLKLIQLIQSLHYSMCRVHKPANLLMPWITLIWL